MSTKVAANVESLPDGKIRKVLVTESYPLLDRVMAITIIDTHTDDLFPGNEQGQLILSSICELTKLNTMNFGTNVCGEINNCSILQQLRTVGISIFAVFVVFKRLQRRISYFSISPDPVKP